MILLWFFISILLAFGIARYNESNKLFWQLTISFILGYSAAVMVCRTFHHHEQSKNELKYVSPTQLPIMTSSNTAYLLADVHDMADYGNVTGSATVGKDFTYTENEVNLALSKVVTYARDQPTNENSYVAPGIRCEYYDDS